MSEYHIEQPTQADVESLIDMHVRSWIDTYPNGEHGVSKQYIEDYTERYTNQEGHAKRSGYIQESYENPDYYLRVAKDENNNVVGFVDARRGDEPELCGLYIDTSALGSGLASELAEPALDWLGRDKDIKLNVIAYNKRAQGFYKKLGFEVIDGSEQQWRDTPMTTVDMLRKGDK